MKTALIAGMMMLSVTAWAQDAPKTADEKPNSVKLTTGLTVAGAVAAMTKTANETVIVDPAVAGSLSAAIAKMPLEQGLAAIASAKHAAWRKVYLKDAEIPRRKDGAIEINKLKQMVELASLAPETTIGVVDPTGSKVAITMRTAVTSDLISGWIKQCKLIYVLYQPSVIGAGSESADVVSDYLAVQKRSYEAFGKMTPEQRSQAMQQGMEEVINMDPQVMMQMARESMEALKNLSPEAKAKLMDISMSMMGGQGNPPPPPPPGQ